MSWPVIRWDLLFPEILRNYGIEGYYNSSLTGIDGRQYGYFSDDSNVEQTIIEASDGNSLELSLDLGTQQIVEKWVNAFKESTGRQKYRSDRGRPFKW